MRNSDWWSLNKSVDDWKDKIDAVCLRMNIVKSFETCFLNNAMWNQKNSSKSSSNFEKRVSLKLELSVLDEFDVNDSESKQMKKRGWKDFTDISEDLLKKFNMLDEHDMNNSTKFAVQKFKRQKRFRRSDRRFLPQHEIVQWYNNQMNLLMLWNLSVFSPETSL